MFLGACTILQPHRWPAGSGEIVLTFDDGPTERTRALLGVLERKEVKATFCFIGENATRHTEVVARVLHERHTIANHTQHHWRPLFSGATLDREIVGADTSMGRGFQSAWFRPPYGLLTPAVRSSPEAGRRQLAWLTFFIDDSRADAAKSAKVMGRIKRRLLAHRGGAIVLHEMRFPDAGRRISKEWLPEAVEEFIDWAHANGFTFSSYGDEP